MDINDPYVVGTICEEDSFDLKPVSKITIVHKNGTKLDDVISRKVTNVVWDMYRDDEGNDLRYQLEENGPEIGWMYAIYELERED